MLALRHIRHQGIARARRGDPEPKAIDGARWIRLTQGRFALVDADRFDELNEHLWRWQTGRGYDNGYAVRSVFVDGKRATVMLHQSVMEVASEVEVDHRSRDTLDCRKSNLRVCTHQQNMANRRKPPTFSGRVCTSRYKGVTRSGKRWRAQIRAFQKHYSLGYYDTEREAAVAYDAAALQHFGEFARLNFPK